MASGSRRREPAPPVDHVRRPQRHILPAIAVWMLSSDSSSAAAHGHLHRGDATRPVAPSDGCDLLAEDPYHAGAVQERIAWPSTSTVQAPHSAAPQPNLVPVRPISSRSTHRGTEGSPSNP